MADDLKQVGKAHDRRIGAAMRSLARKAGPSATDMIRADHTRVVAAFHRYKTHSSPARKKTIVSLISTALLAAPGWFDPL